MKKLILAVLLLAATTVNAAAIDFPAGAGATAAELEAGLLGDLQPYAAEFAAAGERTGMDAAMYAAIAAAESGWGGSQLAENRNNLFGWTSSDGDFAYFDSPEDCIRHCTDAIAEHYLTPGGKHHHGATLEAVSIRYCPAMVDVDGDGIPEPTVNAEWVELVTDTYNIITRRIAAAKEDVQC